MSVGDQYGVECPHCGRPIYDIWDLGIEIVAGARFQCPICGAYLVIEWACENSLSLMEVSSSASYFSTRRV